ncbi:MAG: lytic transglycosylase domain-containing protein [Erythrobacter sp.]
MILARLAFAMGLSCATLIAFPAKADVMEIDADGARWIAGGGTAITHVDMNAGDGDALAEVPAEVFVPDFAVADPATQSGLVPAAYKAKVAELSARYDLSPTLIEALVWQESRWRASAVSPVGARGLAQLMPGTARDLGVNPDDPFANLEGGARYLRAQLDRFGGDLEKALAAYNAGPGRVERAGGIPRIRETQNYVAAIMGRLADHSRE